MSSALRSAACAKPRRSVAARAWQKVTTMPELQAAQHRRVVVPVEAGGDNFKILVQELNGEVYALKNKCTHLNLPLQGKVVGKPVVGECIECPFHGTKYSLKDGSVQGEWAPGFPSLPFVGKVRTQGPVQTYETRTEGDTVEVNVA